MESSKEVLRLLEEGEIDAAEAVRRLSDGDRDDGQGAVRGENERRWWMVFSILLAMLRSGIALGIAGGAWWICAVPLLLMGALGGLIMVAARGAPWACVRVDLREGSWPQTIRFSLPMPLRPAAWVLRGLRPWVRRRELVDLDLVMTGLDEALRSGKPITVEVEEPWGGERVEITLG